MNLEAAIAQNREWAYRLAVMLLKGDVTAGPRLNRANDAYEELIYKRGIDPAPYRMR